MREKEGGEENTANVKEVDVFNRTLVLKSGKELECPAGSQHAAATRPSNGCSESQATKNLPHAVKVV